MMKYGVFLWLALLASTLMTAQKKLIVAQDGSGQFTTVQAALNTVPEGNKTPVTIYIKKGT